jgi:acetylornithine/succinyldiaminopimelate/putrescine aminotransferase
MARERRYTIFKHADIDKYLTEEQKEKLFELDSHISSCRQQEGRGLMTGLVIEKDWPEFEPAWSMIEKRIDSEPDSE